jgi:hypothetical protein
MPSSYTSSLRLTLPQTGDLIGSWGNVVNSGVTSLVDQAVAGSVTVTMVSDTNYTLSSTNGSSDEARNMFINVTGGPHTVTTNVICPPVSKLFVVTNNTSGGQTIVFKTAAGLGVSVLNGLRVMAYCDGTNVGFLSSWGVSGTQELLGSTLITGAGAQFRATNTDTAQFASARVTLKGPAGTNRATSLLHGNSNVGGTTNYFAIESLDSSDAYLQALTLYDYSSNSWIFNTANAERMRIDGGGNVLIGTNTVISKLTLDGEFAFAGGTGKALYHYYNSSTNYASVNTAPSGDIFWTTGVGAPAERMRLTNDGKLGVGTNNPAGFKLGVANGSVLLGFTTDNTNAISYSNGGYYAGTTGPSELVLVTNNNARIVVTAAGGVGVGTNNPGSHKLAVAGGSVLLGFNTDNSSAYSYADGTYHAGTTNASSLVLVTNNAARAVINSVGEVGVGRLPVSGQILSVASNLYTVGPGDVTNLIQTTGTGVNDVAQTVFWNSNGLSSLSGTIGYRSTGAATPNEFFISQNSAATGARLGLYRGGAEYIRLTTAFLFSKTEIKSISTDVEGFFVNLAAYNTAASGGAKIVTVEPDGTFTSNVSTRRVKTAIQPLNDAALIMGLNPVTFKRKKLINGVYVDTPLNDTIEYGFLAEEVAEVDPRLATYEKVRDANGDVVVQPDGVAWFQLFAPMVRFTQQLKGELDALRAELDALKGAK